MSRAQRIWRSGDIRSQRRIRDEDPHVLQRVALRTTHLNAQDARRSVRVRHGARQLQLRE